MKVLCRRIPVVSALGVGCFVGGGVNVISGPKQGMKMKGNAFINGLP